MPSQDLPPFRFGVQCSSPPDVTAAHWRNLALKVEDLGYYRLTVSDHLDDQLAPIAALMCAADATSTLRVGALVFCNDYRHPVLLAKEAATLDILSEGRFELGMGAGWMTSDYRAAGIEMERAGIRIARLEEAVQVVRGLFSEGPCDFDGEHYQIRGLSGSPKPVQSPLPILIGGGGKKVLQLAGRHGDIVGLNPALPNGVIDASAGPDATEAATDRKIGWIREAAGARFGQIELHTRIHLAIVTDDRQGTAEALAPALGLTPHEALASPHALCGTVEEMVDDLLYRRERFAIASIGISLDSLDAMAPVVAALAGS